MNLYMRILETRLRQMMEPGIFVGENREVLFYAREWKQGWVAELQRRERISANREHRHCAVTRLSTEWFWRSIAFSGYRRTTVHRTVDEGQKVRTVSAVPAHVVPVSV